MVENRCDVNSSQIGGKKERPGGNSGIRLGPSRDEMLIIYSEFKEHQTKFMVYLDREIYVCLTKFELVSSPVPYFKRGIRFSSEDEFRAKELFFLEIPGESYK